MAPEALHETNGSSPELVDEVKPEKIIVEK